MNIFTKIKKGKLDLNLECALATLNNFNANTVGYKKSYEIVRNEVINDLTIDTLDEIDIKISINQAVELFNEIY